MKYPWYISGFIVIPGLPTQNDWTLVIDKVDNEVKMYIFDALGTRSAICTLTLEETKKVVAALEGKQ